MAQTPICKTCSFCARVRYVAHGTTYGVQHAFMCRHPTANHGDGETRNQIGRPVQPWNVTPPVKTSPMWCPLRTKTGGGREW